ncbi:DUF898 domain-containing protein [Erysipelothrix urinaevulpis]|uniref:DUF898 family protein n=1 Tax=Erysipelothrix urinaevulpis TaxID=2683717 RepID=UPI001357D7A9|nr:DUF898 family protein [Erysipelothrix urinaevulpis]
MKNSYFDGGLLSLVFLQITNAILLVITFGLAAPWAITRSYQWEIDHTVLDGQRLIFDGKAMSLFANWVKWLFLTIITVGIYGFWVRIKVIEWKTKHTHIINY